jgi:hypothetical protein
LVVKRKVAFVNCPIFPAKIDDFHLKYWILRENAKNNKEGILGKRVEGFTYKE